ncbi:type VI secretion system Vgr family protein [Gilliamella sp. wkB171]|uniref:type VI secretion system Vgr family protein n=1 Tax=Gilliamella sp. wkB171 TaxID=3120258 RepID=UPI0009E5CA86|nr:type VI secretion system Vgr family protein [Gilliamella apicola]
MPKALSNLISTLGEKAGINNMLSDVSHNRYTLTIEALGSAISVLDVSSDETLNQPWHYRISFTSSDKHLTLDSVLNQKAAFIFHPANNFDIVSKVTQTLNTLSAFAPLESSLTDLLSSGDSRIVYGVITEFSQLSVNKEQAHYQVVLSSVLAKLALSHNSAIFQNLSVVGVVEEVLRGHGFTGIDYRLELKDRYPVRELITQWQESDLTFIQRILADVGIWFRFETHAEHNCDVMVLSDYEQGYQQAKDIDYKLPSGTLDAGVDSVWDMGLHSQMVEASVQVQDYNYRDAGSNLQTEVNSQPTNGTTYGTNYRYEEHYKGLNDNGTDNTGRDSDTANRFAAGEQNGNREGNQDNSIESGTWYARIRHEQAISSQVIISGKSNRCQLVPGQRIRITGNPLADTQEGFIIISVAGHGNRTDAYEVAFTAIPYQVLKPYRPKPIAWPQISGTLPARVTSPDNDTYGYIDTQGRYRVKFNFDLKSWNSGEESLWVRLAKPYAGSRYGFHFPLIDGTEVAIAFTNGNPDRPYIAYAMHDSAHPDHVATANKHRNVIRTATNNKLRMDDKRGQEHIKLATEYGKTQLNIGHLVNQNKEQRGEGFELRTDEWGALAAAKGLYLTTQTEPKAQGKQLDMQGAITQLENALSIAKSLQNAAKQSEAHSADTDSQNQLKANLTELAQSGILAYAQEGIALTSPENIQLSTSSSISLTSENQTDITALKTITLSGGESMGLFAHKSGMKVFANQGDINLQAQNANLNMAAKQDIKIDSVDGELTITASQKITLICGGSYIKISEEGIELGTAGNVYIKSNALQKMGAKTIAPNPLALPYIIGDYAVKFICKDETGKIYANERYIATLPDGRKIQGQTDKNGYTQPFHSTNENETITLELISR